MSDKGAKLTYILKKGGYWYLSIEIKYRLSQSFNSFSLNNY